MPTLSIDELLDLVHRHGAYAGPDLCATAGAIHESGGVTDIKAAGDEDSWGIFQCNRGGGMGQGYSVAELCDPEINASIMVPVYVAQYERGQAQGLTGERLARFTYIQAERPDGFPSLDCPAADDVAAHWRALQEAPMPEPTPRTYDPDYSKPPWQQRQSWTCSICSAAWGLGAVGVDTTPASLQDPLVTDGIVGVGIGLLNHTGMDLESWLQRRYGLQTERAYPASWPWVLERAGRGPILLGGDGWDHWVGVRRALDADTLELANSADNWMDVHQRLPSGRWDELGPFAAIFIQADAPPEDEVTQAEYDALQAKYDELTQQISDDKVLIDNTQGAWADAAISAVQGAKQTGLKKDRNALLDAALAALATIKRGGPPEPETN